MSYGNANAARYREVEVLSLSPARRLLLLYTHLLSALRQGHAAIAANRPGERVARLGRAHAILEELLYTLDYDQGGDLAVQLGALYECFMEEVLRASRTPDADRLQRVIANLAELHAAFAAAAEQVEAQEPALPAAASA